MTVSDAEGGSVGLGGLTPSPAGIGAEGIGGLQTGGGGQPQGAEAVGTGSCQTATAGGAEGGVICSAAGGLVKGFGVIELAGEGMGGTTEVGRTVGSGAVEGVSGGAWGTRLVGVRTCALATVGVVLAGVVAEVAGLGLFFEVARFGRAGNATEAQRHQRHTAENRCFEPINLLAASMRCHHAIRHSLPSREEPKIRPESPSPPNPWAEPNPIPEPFDPLSHNSRRSDHPIHEHSPIHS